MKKFFILFSSVLLVNCSVFHPKKFNKESLLEELLTEDRKPILFNKVITQNSKQKKFIQVYASYCPVSQDSFDEVLAFQEKNKNVEYVFLSVDHSYYDWKRGLKEVKLKVKGKHLYIQNKGKGALGVFLNLKTVPRFMVIDEVGNISLFKSSKVSAKIKQKIK